MPNDFPPDLETSASLAEEFDVDVRTIHRWVRQGLITPYLRAPGVRGAYLFRRSEIKKPSRRRTERAAERAAARAA